MNQTEQELKRINEIVINYGKQCILLGLEAGRKKVFDFIDKNKTNQGSHFLFDEEDYQEFKEAHEIKHILEDIEKVMGK